MELNIVKERDMGLLSRKRIALMVDTGKATPSRADFLAELSKKLKVPKDLIVIKHIYSQFGSTKVKLIVHVYADKEKLKLFEHSNLLKKHEPKKEAKEEQDGKEGNKEE